MSNSSVNTVGYILKINLKLDNVSLFPQLFQTLEADGKMFASGFEVLYMKTVYKTYEADRRLNKKLVHNLLWNLFFLGKLVS